MKSIWDLSGVPKSAGLYALLSGRDVAYVGIAGKNLRDRLGQHLVRRDSSVTTGVTAVSLNPDRLTEVQWWCSPTFEDRGVLEAAELVAFEALNPIMRSRGAVTERAREFAADPDFRVRTIEMINAGPTGGTTAITLGTALQRIRELESRIQKLEGGREGTSV